MTSQRLCEMTRWLKPDVRGLKAALGTIFQWTGATVWLLILTTGILWPQLSKPEPHGYEWFMHELCPRMYATWQQQTTRKPLPQGPLYEGCLNEARSMTPSMAHARQVIFDAFALGAASGQGQPLAAKLDLKCHAPADIPHCLAETEAALLRADRDPLRPMVTRPANRPY
jgi:hypothetical protein